MLNDKTEKMIVDTFGQLPAYFVPNVGQKEDEKIYYEMKEASHGAFFTSEGVILTFFETSSQTVGDLPTPELGIPDNQELAKEVRGVRLDLRFLDANTGVKPEGRLKGTGKVNYLKGNDPTKWITNLSTYEKIVYRDLWPGIDLVFRGKNGQLKYDFVVQPGISSEVIRLTYRGADSLSLDEDGNLRIRTPFGVLTDESPNSYQERDGQKVSVTSSFVLEQDENGENVYAFKIGDEYDPRYALIIDPGLIYSTYLGGSGLDLGVDIAVDSSGNAYVVGATQSAVFPTTAGVFDTALSGLQDVFVTKLNPAGSGLVYSTYLGGSGVDSGLSIAVDTSGNAYVTGLTTSTNFPTTVGAFDTSFNGAEDAFVTKLNFAGSGLIYSTYLGGSGVDRGAGIAVDSSGNAYVTGLTTSSNFPTTAGAFDTTLGGAGDAFVTKLNPAGTGLSDLVYSTYLGGSGSDQGFGIAIDASGNAYVTGVTDSTDFPTTAGAFDTSLNGSSDAFVTKLNPAGSGLSDLVYSTYLGGSGGDAGFAITVDTSGNAYVTGRTDSSNFPTTSGAFDTSFNGGLFDAFVTKVNPAGTGLSDLVYSTYLGGSGNDQGHGIAVDGMGNAYVTGKTASSNFPTTSDAFDTSFNGGAFDAFVTRLNPAGTGLSDLAYSTYLGGGGDENGPLLTVGIAIDGIGNAYVTGATASTDFPTTAGAFDTTFNGGPFDAFVAKINTVSEPEITCPDDITVQNDPGVCGAVVNYPPPTVNDECPAGFTVVCDPPSGSFFPVGTTPVTCTVTDPCGDLLNAPLPSQSTIPNRRLSSVRPTSRYQMILVNVERSSPIRLLR